MNLMLHKLGVTYLGGRLTTGNKIECLLQERRQSRLSLTGYVHRQLLLNRDADVGTDAKVELHTKSHIMIWIRRSHQNGHHDVSFVPDRFTRRIAKTFGRRIKNSRVRDIARPRPVE